MHAIIKDGQIMLFDSYLFKESIKEIPDRQWHPDEKAWIVPANSESIETLRLIGCIFSEEMLELEKQICKKQTSSNEICNIKILPMPIKVEPYEHQKKAYEFVCSLMGFYEGGDVDEHF